jgi:hypothetical protein
MPVNLVKTRRWIAVQLGADDIPVSRGAKINKLFGEGDSAVWQGFNKFLDRLGSRFSLAINLGLFSVLSGAVTTVAAWASSLTPIWWIAAFWFGAFFAALLGLILTSIWKRIVILRATKRMLAAADRINPLETVFRNHRISVIDLLPPIGSEIHGKTFVDCEIVGPANFVIAPGCQLSQCGGELIDGVVARDDARPFNALIFMGCTFRNCRFYRITFVVTESWRIPFVAAFSGINWITYHLDAAPPIALEPELSLESPKDGP